MATKYVTIGKLEPGEFRVLAPDFPDLDRELMGLIVGRLQDAWAELPEKVRKVITRHAGYRLRVEGLGGESRDEHRLDVLSGVCQTSGKDPFIAFDPLALFVDANMHIPEVSWLRMMFVHELYGHGIGCHDNYLQMRRRYNDYVSAPNPWLLMEEATITRRKPEGPRFPYDNLGLWIRFQLHSSVTAEPLRLSRLFGNSIIKPASSLLLFGGWGLDERDWSSSREVESVWRTPGNAVSCPPTWRDAWLTEGVALPKYVIDESLQYVLDYMELREIATDDYWRSLLGQDHLVRPYSLKNSREAIAEHLAIGVLGLAQRYQCERVCGFLEAATDILLDEGYRRLCFCGTAIHNQSDQYCSPHMVTVIANVCGVCHTPIANLFEEYVPGFVGVCDAEWCQGVVAKEIAYQYLLDGREYTPNEHYSSLERVPVRDLGEGDRVVVTSPWDVYDPNPLIQPIPEDDRENTRFSLTQVRSKISFDGKATIWLADGQTLVLDEGVLLFRTELIHLQFAR